MQNMSTAPDIPRSKAKGAVRVQEAYRTILVHVESSSASDHRLAAVVDLALRYSAKVIGVGGCAPLYLDDIVAIDNTMIRDQECADLKDAEAHFYQITRPLGPGATWRSGVGDPCETMAQWSSGADLVVTSRSHGRRASTVNASDIILAAGLPVLVLPLGATIIAQKRLVIGWKNTRETRRAVTDALPLLMGAESVSIVAVCADDGLAVNGLDAIIDRLGQHGVVANSHVIRKHSDDHAADLVEFAHADDADMIVAGAYGHPRVLEWCWGGATAELLQTSPFAVLFSH